MSILSALAEILIVGHSLVGPDLPPMLEGALRAAGQDVTVEAQIINGAPLSYQWENGAGAEGVDARARLAGAGADVLVLTEALPLADQIRWNDSAGRVAAYAGLAWETRPETRVFIYETWHSRDIAAAQGEDVPLPWAERIAADLPLWESLADKANAVRPAGAAPVRLIPAGQAMALADKAAREGHLPGISEIGALFEDDIHPNGKGQYLVSMVHLAAITGENPAGLPARLTRQWQSRDAVISAELAGAMQAIAWQAVSAQWAREAALAGEAAPPPDPTPISNPALAFGLSGVNDWSVQQPFLDVMKTARPWTGHLPGQWGGMDHAALAAGGWLDANGWPRAIPPEISGLSTLVLTDLPVDAAGVAGRYVLRWQGKGEFTLDGRAQNIETIPEGLGFDFTPGEGAVILTITATDAVDPLRAFTLLREDRVAAHDAGAIFNPDWLARIRGARMVRFMDWMATNNSNLATLEESPKISDYTWARNGVPVEVMVALANELDADPWFTLPHQADDALVRFYAEAVADLLEPGLKAYVEYSNEVWNWQFEQAQWAEDQARARWGGEYGWLQFYALRATEVAAIWTEVFGDQAEARLVRVVSTQTGYLGVEDQILNAPLVVAEGRPAPATAFDAYAVTGYFAALLGSEAKRGMVQDWLDASQAAAEAEAAALEPALRTPHVAAHRYDLAVARAVEELRDGRHSGLAEDTLDDLIARILPYQAKVARDHGLDLVMYEGGTHVVGQGGLVDDAALSAFFTHLNYTTEMGALYADLLAGWASLSDAPFNAFVDVLDPDKWGSWGALRHLGDENPRWRVLAKGCNGC